MDDWRTPSFITDALGPADFDPCPGTEQPKIDGTKIPWNGYVFLNPPYSRNMTPWMKRAIEHQNTIVCVFVRTDTKWLQEGLMLCDSVLFLSGRVAFLPHGCELGSTGVGGTILLAFGSKADKRLRSSKLPGVLMVRA